MLQMHNMPAPAAAQASRAGGIMTPLVASLALNGLALVAAFARVQWGAAPPGGGPVDLSWLYVNLSLGATWLLIWPTLPAPARDDRMSALGRQTATLAIGALPFALVAAYLEQSLPNAIAAALAVQLALAAFAAGVLAWRNGTAERQHTLAAALATLYLITPLVAYLQSEFAAFWPAAWQWLAPPLLLARAAGGTLILWPTLAYGLLGVALLALRATLH